MRSAFRRKSLTTAAGLALTAAVLAAGPPHRAPAPPPAAAATSLRGEFTDAAREFGVPRAVLMAVAWNESRWEGHDGHLSDDGGYGMMDLTDVLPARSPGLHTLRAAARLTGIAPGRLRTRDADNLRGGAALLAADERRLAGALPADPAAWYGAVARYGHAHDGAVARRFADEVYAVLASGASATTAAGERVTLPALPGPPPARRAVPPGPTGPGGAQCPARTRCAVVPAAPEAYQEADRPRDGLRIRYLVIHDTEGGYDSSVRSFQDPEDGAAAHYVMRASDGAVTQMVPDQDVAFHAGNYWFNLHSVGIEHEGFAADGATWYTEAQYRATADLVRYLAARYGVPLDREHVIGHDQVPGISTATVAGMHWDPGPYWDWDHFMALLGAGPGRTGRGTPATGTVVTIAPRFATDRQTVRVCGQPTGGTDGGPGTDDSGTDDGGGACRDQREPSAFLPVRTAPRASAPLYGDPSLHPRTRRGTDAVDDWGATVSAGERFVVAGHRDGWTAIWFSGAKVWFADPHGVNTAPAPGSIVLTPAPGTASAPVYGQGYPAPADYPAGAGPSARAPLGRYRVPRGQAYVATAPPDGADDYVAASGTVVTGRARLWTVQYGHRLALLDARDVRVR